MTLRTYQPLDLSQNTLLGLLDVFLTTSDLDLGFLSSGFPFLAATLSFFIVIDVDFNTKLIPELVDATTLSTNNASNIFTINVKISGLRFTG